MSNQKQDALDSLKRSQEKLTECATGLTETQQQISAIPHIARCWPSRICIVSTIGLLLYLLFMHSSALHERQVFQEAVSQTTQQLNSLSAKVVALEEKFASLSMKVVRLERPWWKWWGR